MPSRALQSYHSAALIIIASLTVMRIAALLISPLNLHGDEAQYWAWAQDLQWGYFTKPPGIAAVIWATTGMFGDAEWAVRLSSPILHGLTAYTLYHVGRLLLSPGAGFWAVVIYLVMPAMWLSAAIVSTDVPLLLCWAVALLAWTQLRAQPSWLWAGLLGLAIGLGLLSKYAMIFFLPALGLAALFDAPTRKALLSPRGIVTALITSLVIWPNLRWNMQHDFATFQHTAENANLEGGPALHPLELLSFWGDQAGVFGPITMVLMLMAVVWALRMGRTRPEFWLAVFTLSPLLVISLEALLSRANANWAITAYMGGSLLLAQYTHSYWDRFKTWLGAGLGLNITAGLVMTALMLTPALADKVGAANAFKRLRGWPQTAAVLSDRFNAGHDGENFAAFAFDKRIQFYDLLYYGLADTAPLYMWMDAAYPANQAELTSPLPAADGPYLLVNYYFDYEDKFKADFERLIPLEPIDIDLGGGKHRRLKLWAAYDYTPTQTRGR